MNVIDRLPAKVVAVHYDSKAILAALFFGQALRREEDVPGEHLVVLLAQVMQRGNVLFGMTRKWTGA